jgi:hypothetical protein
MKTKRWKTDRRIAVRLADIDPKCIELQGAQVQREMLVAGAAQEPHLLFRPDLSTL